MWRVVSGSGGNSGCVSRRVAIRAALDHDRRGVGVDRRGRSAPCRRRPRSRRPSGSATTRGPRRAPAGPSRTRAGPACPWSFGPDEEDDLLLRRPAPAAPAPAPASRRARDSASASAEHDRRRESRRLAHAEHCTSSPALDVRAPNASEPERHAHLHLARIVGAHAARAVVVRARRCPAI